MDVGIEKSHFLNEKQKEVKQSIMNGLFDVIRENISNNSEILDSQSSTDVVLSCLIMFSRELLVNLIMGSSPQGELMEEIIIQYNSTVRNEVRKSIEEMTGITPKEKD